MPALVTSDLLAESLRRNGRVEFRVRGGSMRPLLRSGDVVMVQAARAKELTAGDVAVFYRAGKIFAHRVIRNTAAALLTKGDAFPDADSPVAQRELLGRVTGVRRGQKHMDLDAWLPRTLGRCMAIASASSALWYAPARAGHRAIKRIWQRLFPVKPN